MLVKKINPEWQPSENPGLRVGDTLEITDPKSLILGGMVVAVGPSGEELSAYELYGVIAENDLDGFEDYLKEKKARAIKAKLEADAAALKAQQDALDAAETKETVTSAPTKTTKK